MADGSEAESVFAVFEGDDNAGREVHGPFPVDADNSHLGVIEALAKDWLTRSPDVPGKTVTLYATRPVRPSSEAGDSRV